MTENNTPDKVILPLLHKSASIFSYPVESLLRSWRYCPFKLSPPPPPLFIHCAEPQKAKQILTKKKKNPLKTATKTMNALLLNDILHWLTSFDFYENHYIQWWGGMSREVRVCTWCTLLEADLYSWLPKPPREFKVHLQL